MLKKKTIKMLTSVLLFLLAAALVIYGYQANENYKEKQGIDTTSGATRLAD